MSGKLLNNRMKERVGYLQGSEMKHEIKVLFIKGNLLSNRQPSFNMNFGRTVNTLHKSQLIVFNFKGRLTSFHKFKPSVFNRKDPSKTYHHDQYLKGHQKSSFDL